MTFLDWCGLIGGVNEILHLAGMLIVSPYFGKLFTMTLLSALYQVIASIIKNKNSGLNYPLVSNENGRTDLFNQNVVYPKSNCSLQIRYTDNSESKINNMKKSINEMKNRWRYSYSFLNILYNIFSHSSDSVWNDQID